MHSDLAQEASTGLENAEHQNCKGCRNCGIYSVLDIGEDGHKHTCKENGDLKGRNSPKLVNSIWWRDEIQHGVNDDCRKRSVGNVEEHCRERIDGQENNNSSDYTSEWSSNTSLGLDGSTRERTGGRICTEERPENICDTNGNHLLGRVNDIVVDTTKGLGDRNMLNQ